MSLKMQPNQFVELRNEIAIEFNSNKKTFSMLCEKNL